MHPNVALLRALYDAQGRGDIDAYLGMLSDAIVFHIPGRSRIAGDYVGKQSVRRHFEEIFELSGGTFRTEVHDVVAGESHAVGLIHVRAEKDGDTVELPRVHVWHVADGLFTELWLHPVDQAAFDEYWGWPEP